MNYSNTPQLRQFLVNDGLLILADKPEFLLNEREFEQHRAELVHQGLPVSEINDHAAFICLTLDHAAPAKPEALKPAQILVQQDQLLKAFSQEAAAQRKAEQQREAQAQSRHEAIVKRADRVEAAMDALSRKWTKDQYDQRAYHDGESQRLGEALTQIDQNLSMHFDKKRRMDWLFFALLLAIVFLLLAGTGHAQNLNIATVVASCGTPPSPYPVAGQPAHLTVDVNGNVCTPTGSGGTSSTIGNAVPSTGTLAGARDTNGNMQPLQLDGAGAGQNLNVNCKAGCSAAGDTVGSTVALNGSGVTASVAMAGENGAEVFIASGTLAGTVVAEASNDGGTTWFSTQFLDSATIATSGSLVLSNPNAALSKVIPTFGPVTNVRVRVSAYTSGTANATLRATVTRPFTLLVGQDATNNFRAMPVDNSGHLYINNDLKQTLNLGVGSVGVIIAGSSTGVNGATAVQVNDSGVVRVDPSGTTTQPVSGTVSVNALPTGSNTIGKVDILGNAGAAMDAAGQNASSPANELLTGGQFNTTPTTISSGNMSPLQVDSKGSLRGVIQDAAGNVRGANVTASNELLVNVNNTPNVTIQSNASINLAQVGGNTVSTGVGAAGTGTARVVDVASGTTGSAVPTQASYIGGNGSGNLKGAIICDNYAFDRSSTADVQLVAISGSTTIYVCGYVETGESTTASDVNLRYATNSNCTTGATNLTPPVTVGTSTSGAMIAGKSIPPGIWSGLKTPASDNLCVHRSAAQTSEIEVWYTQF